MLIAFPLACLPMIFLALGKWKNTPLLLKREKAVISLILWSVFLVAATELLSAPHLINTLSISISWLALLLLLVFIYKDKFRSLKFPKVPKIDLESKILLISIFVIAIITLILAVYVAPNNIDALSYQLARLPHWIQNKSVEFYATNISWQLFLAPLASYMRLHLQILSGGDYFSNPIQWLFMLGNLTVASLIAKHFGANSRIQILSAFVAATIPIGILEASSSQDDHILTFFLAAFVYFCLKFSSWKKDKLLLFVAGMSLGLGFLTKQLAYLYAFPFLFWFLWIWTTKFGLKKAIGLVISVILPALFINFGFLYRSFYLNGLPFFSVPTSSWDLYINRPVGSQSLISGVIKNISILLVTPFELANKILLSSAVGIIKFFKIDPNNIGLNSQGASFTLPKFIPSEYFAPNPLHIVLALAASFYLKKSLRPYLIALVCSFILISTILSWHVANSRYFLPLLTLMAPAIAIALEKRNKHIRSLVIILLVIESLYFLFFNVGKPLISKSPIFMYTRYEQYFLNVPMAHDKSLPIFYKEMAKFVAEKGYRRVGVLFDENDYPLEYPLWIALSQNDKNVVLEGVQVNNSSSKFAKPFNPQVVIYIAGDKNLLKKYIDKNIPIIGISN